MSIEKTALTFVENTAPMVAEKKEPKPRKELSPEDVRAHKNLYKIWNAYRAQHSVSQAEFAESQLGWSQGNFSQYLTGQVRIGNKALITLTKALGCETWDIREELMDHKIVKQHYIYQCFFEEAAEMIGADPKMQSLIQETRKRIEATEIEEEKKAA